MPCRFLHTKFILQIWPFWLFWAIFWYKYYNEGMKKSPISHQIRTQRHLINGIRHKDHQNRSRNAHSRTFCKGSQKILVFIAFLLSFIYLKMPLLPPLDKSIVQHVPGQIWASKTPNLNSHIYRNHIHQGHAATTILRALLVDDDLPQ